MVHAVVYIRLSTHGDRTDASADIHTSIVNVLLFSHLLTKTMHSYIVNMYDKLMDRYEHLYSTE